MESLTPAQISQRISISVTTVNRHIANIYLKCHISNRQQLYKLFAEQQTN
jgi:DNA-binding CsgD family transcriptional regulator